VVNSFSLSQYQNIGKAQIQGVEFEGTYDAGDVQGRPEGPVWCLVMVSRIG